MRVELINRPAIDADALNRFLYHEQVVFDTDAKTDPEELVEIAGRLCYMSFDKPRPGGNEAYMRNILASEHYSVLEHAAWTFLVTGISRSLSHELVRHRIGFSYSQLSQRYVDESKAEFIEPEVISNDPEADAIWHGAVNAAHMAYCALVEILMKKGLPRKVARGAARSVLPNATETKICVSLNARSAREFLLKRASRAADVEIRQLAGKIYHLLRSEAPNLFLDFKEVNLDDGTIEVVKE